METYAYPTTKLTYGTESTLYRAPLTALSLAYSVIIQWITTPFLDLTGLREQQVVSE